MNPSDYPPPEDDLAPLRAFWLEMGQQLVKESSKTLDETARQIIGVAGILEGLYFHAITYSGLRGQPLPGGTLLIYLLPILFFLISLGVALIIFLPARYKMEMRSWEAARLIHQRT